MGTTRERIMFESFCVWIYYQVLVPWTTKSSKNTRHGNCILTGPRIQMSKWTYSFDSLVEWNLSPVSGETFSERTHHQLIKITGHIMQRILYSEKAPQFRLKHYRWWRAGFTYSPFKNRIFIWALQGFEWESTKWWHRSPTKEGRQTFCIGSICLRDWRRHKIYIWRITTWSWNSIG